MRVYRPILLLNLLIAVFLGLNPAHSAAEELQITDYLGLIRAQRSVRGKVGVRITVLRSSRFVFDDAEPGPVLTQRTGFSGDIEALKEGSGAYMFNGVSPGVWRIRLRNKALLLDAVEIIDGSASEKERALPQAEDVPTDASQKNSADLKK